MDERIKTAVKTDRWIDITTLGCKTGLHRRIEIGIHQVGGEYYITGMPGRRGWYANLKANPQFILHFKESDVMDVRADAVPVTDGLERRKIFTKLLDEFGGNLNLEEWLAHSKLIRVKIK